MALSPCCVNSYNCEVTFQLSALLSHSNLILKLTFSLSLITRCLHCTASYNVLGTAGCKVQNTIIESDMFDSYSQLYSRLYVCQHFTASCTAGCTCVYTLQPVVQPAVCVSTLYSQLYSRLYVCQHFTASCTAGCTCVYTLQPLVRQVVLPAVKCITTFTEHPPHHPATVCISGFKPSLTTVCIVNIFD